MRIATNIWYEPTAAGGWARDSDGVSSPYVRLGLMQKLGI
jgi:hypothetical protein